MTTSLAGCSGEPLLFFEREMISAEVLGLTPGEVAIYSGSNPSTTGPNEDAAGLVPVGDHSVLLMVADGMGGASAGERAARIAVTSIAESVSSFDTVEVKFRTAVLDGIEEANRGVRDMALGAATTLAAVEVGSKGVRPYHVGDSAILLVGGRGRIKWRAVAHSPVGYALEAGVLDESEALEHGDRHIVSNFIGSSEMRIEVGPRLALAPRDTLLLATDGLTDNLKTETIVELLLREPIGRAVQELAERCREQMMTRGTYPEGKPDDLTVLAFRPRPREK